MAATGLLSAQAELDVARFEDLARRGNQAMSASPADPTRAAEALGAALECWRGAALADVADASWARGDITRLEELRAATLESWLQARLGLGDHVGVVGAAENTLAKADPLRERLWAQLMVALYRSGRQAEALRAYQRLRQRASARNWASSPPANCGPWKTPSCSKNPNWIGSPPHGPTASPSRAQR